MSQQQEADKNMKYVANGQPQGQQPSRDKTWPFSPPAGDAKESDHFFNIVFWFQALMILFMGLWTEYGSDCDISKKIDGENNNNLYATYQDVHVMMFIGFGFLMTFLKKYGLSSLSFNFMLTVIIIQWNILTSGTEGFWKFVYENEWSHKIHLTMPLLIESDFAAACSLISMGAVLGKCNAVQLVVMAIFEMVFFNCNLMLCFSWLGITDQGGSIVVHTFGAFFGLAVSYIISPEAAKDHDDNSSTRTSDTFAMIGTLFLWMFWPSFNGALATGEMQNLVVVNTTLALCGSAVATFLFSFKLRGNGKFDMVDIQNATLAGGVAVGTISNMLIGPAGALGTGFVAGAFCVVGYVKIAPFLERTIGLQDTCGVQNLHGYSGIMGGIASAITLALATEKNYGVAATVFFGEGAKYMTAKEAAGYQIAGLALTLVFAIVSGLITGLIVKQFASNKVNARLFEDDVAFEAAEHHVGNSTNEDEEMSKRVHKALALERVQQSLEANY